MTALDQAKLHTYHPGEEERFLEKIIFGHRRLLLCFFVLGTLFFSYQVTQLRPDVSFEKMILMEHPLFALFSSMPMILERREPIYR